MSKSSTFPPFVEKSLAKVLSKSVSAAFQDPQNRREFEAWYEKTYGKKYVWKKGSISNEPQPQTL